MSDSMFDIFTFFAPNVSTDTLITLKLCAIATLLLSTPFIYDVFTWFMFAVDGLCLSMCSLSMNDVRFDCMFSYNYLKDRHLIPMEKLNDRKYIADRIMRMGLFGIITCFGLCGLISPTSLKFEV